MLIIRFCKRKHTQIRAEDAYRGLPKEVMAINLTSCKKCYINCRNDLSFYLSSAFYEIDNLENSKLTQVIDLR
jgi:hypothetical protein